MTTTQQSWHVSEFAGQWEKEIFDNTGRMVALIPHDSFTAEEEISHARLIAAAPDLLAALEAAEDCLHNMTTAEFQLCNDRPVRDLIRAALAKAKGQ